VTKVLPESRVLGAGFIGSHLVDRLLKEGYEVVVLDNFFRGKSAREDEAECFNHPILDFLYEAEEV